MPPWKRVQGDTFAVEMKTTEAVFARIENGSAASASISTAEDEKENNPQTAVIATSAVARSSKAVAATEDEKKDDPQARVIAKYRIASTSTAFSAADSVITRVASASTI